jgi:hypothetical protein
MKLYLVSTFGLGDYYVVANATTEAEDAVKSLLHKKDYGFSRQREVVQTKHLAEEMTTIPNTTGCIADALHMLIIAKGDIDG